MVVDEQYKIVIDKHLKKFLWNLLKADMKYFYLVAHHIDRWIDILFLSGFSRCTWSTIRTLNLISCFSQDFKMYIVNNQDTKSSFYVTQIKPGRVSLEWLCIRVHKKTIKKGRFLLIWHRQCLLQKEHGFWCPSHFRVYKMNQASRRLGSLFRHSIPTQSKSD